LCPTAPMPPGLRLRWPMRCRCVRKLAIRSVTLSVASLQWTVRALLTYFCVWVRFAGYQLVVGCGESVAAVGCLSCSVHGTSTPFLIDFPFWQIAEQPPPSPEVDVARLAEKLETLLVSSRTSCSTFAICSFASSCLRTKEPWPPLPSISLSAFDLLDFF